MNKIKEIYHSLLLNPLNIYKLSYEEIVNILKDTLSKLRETPQLLKINGKYLVVGDTHGDVYSTISSLKMDVNIVFLGDYVDRGPYQFENLILLLVAFLSNEKEVILLRGNHESPLMNKHYGFISELESKTRNRWKDYYSYIKKIFANLPYSAVLNKRIFLVHGGIAKGLGKINEILKLPKNDLIPSNNIAFQLLWNDPDESVDFFAPSLRGEGIFLYGEKAVDIFLQENNLERIVRAHEYFYLGYRTFFNEKVITIFSCSYYPIESPKALFIEDDKIEIIKIDHSTGI